MKFNELKEMVQKNKETGENFTLEVKRYLPFVMKTMFINDMVVSCIYENEKNMKVIDFSQKKLCFDIYILRDYAGIEFDQDEVIEQYDYLKQNGIINYVYDIIDNKNDLDELTIMVNDTLQQEIQTNNSFEGVLSKGIQDLISKIPESGKIDKWMKSTVKAIKDFDPSKHEKLNELLNYAKSEGTKVE